ncbi:MAG: hypothetical protein IJ708_08755 [Clostridia bacterium]|nr:hypothetical protein [Clostridia bacterium]
MRFRLSLSLLLTCCLLFSSLPVCAISQSLLSDPFILDLESRYIDPDRANATEVRWWMAEGAHTDETILEEIQAMYDAGFRGMELCEQTDDQVSESDFGYGTDQWDHDLKLALNKALDLGMTVSLTSGTNWATANIPGLDPQSQAASQVVILLEEYLKTGKSRSGSIPMEKKAGVKVTPLEETAQLIGVYALRQTTSNKADPIRFDAASVQDLTSSLVLGDDGRYTLEWAVPDESNWRIFYYWQQGAAQASHPAAESAYCINYFDRAGVDALRAYWEAHILDDEALNEKIRQGDVQVFMDSLEIDLRDGVAFWASDMADAFLARKGYDIRPYLFLTQGLPELTAWKLSQYGSYALAEEDGDTLRILNDLFDVQTQLYMERMLTPLRDWLHTYGIQTRAQISYGRHLEISEPILAVDYPEAENLNQNNQVDIYRLWTGGAKLQNKVLSSETGAVGGHNYTLQDHLMEAYTLYAAGFQRIIWHVWSSRFGPGETENWPGYKVPGVVFHSFYTFGQGEPSFTAYPAFNRHLARVQQLLREGVSRTDIGMPYLRYDQNLPVNGDPTGENWLYNHTTALFPSASLQEAGYTYDYFSPAFLESEDAVLDTRTMTLEKSGYKALVLFQNVLTVQGAQRILSLASQGFPVVIVDGAAEHTPYLDGNDALLRETLSELAALPSVRRVAHAGDVITALTELGIVPYAGFTEANRQLLTQTRRDGDTEYLYVYNYCDASYIPSHTEGATDTHGTVISTELAVEGLWEPYQIDAWSGKANAIGSYTHENGITRFPLTLDYGDIALFALKSSGDDKLHATLADTQIRYLEDGTLCAVCTQEGEHSVTLSDGTVQTVNAHVPEAQEITGWDIRIFSRAPGSERETRTETLLGKTVTESVRTTDITEISLTTDALASWKELPGVGEDIIGTAVYTSAFTWEGSADGAFLSFGHYTDSYPIVEAMQVYINGQPTGDLSMTCPVIDISPYLVQGTNQIELHYESNLSNLLGDTVPAGWWQYHTEKHAYGPRSAHLIPYVILPLE